MKKILIYMMLAFAFIAGKCNIVSAQNNEEATAQEQNIIKIGDKISEIYLMVGDENIKISKNDLSIDYGNSITIVNDNLLIDKKISAIWFIGETEEDYNANTGKINIINNKIENNTWVSVFLANNILSTYKITKDDKVVFKKKEDNSFALYALYIPASDISQSAESTSVLESDEIDNKKDDEVVSDDDTTDDDNTKKKKDRCMILANEMMNSSYDEGAYTKDKKAINESIKAKYAEYEGAKTEYEASEKKYKETKQATDIVKGVGTGVAIAGGVAGATVGIMGLVNSGKSVKEYFLEESEVLCYHEGSMNNSFRKKGDPAYGCAKKCVYAEDGQEMQVNEKNKFTLYKYSKIPPSTPIVP